MQLINTQITDIVNEHYLLETLNLDNKKILDIGCGKAVMTKKIASTGVNRQVIACDIDKQQYEKNIAQKINNIDFVFCSAQELPFDDFSIDMICMFKSFHHIPQKFMKKALEEMNRVLKKNSLLYISEPLFYGKQNDLLSVFHNEEEVRQNAFNAIENSVLNDKFKLFKEIFFNTEVTYNSFEDFKTKHMNLSYNDYVISEQMHTEVKKKYNNYANSEGVARFLKAFRVDILQKK